MLSVLADEDRRDLLQLARRRRFARGEVIFHEGDPGDTLHLIDKGHVAVRVTTPMGDVATLIVLGPGEVVGELALLDPNARRTATVITLEPTQTLTLHRDQLTELRQRHPALDRFLIVILSEEVTRLSALLVEALHVPVDTRVIRRLVALLDSYGDGRAGTEIPLTQEDLASLAGTSRATVNRVLGEAESAGIVKVSRGRITVLDPDELQRRSS